MVVGSVGVLGVKGRISCYISAREVHLVARQRARKIHWLGVHFALALAHCEQGHILRMAGGANVECHEIGQLARDCSVHEVHKSFICETLGGIGHG